MIDHLPTTRFWTHVATRASLAILVLLLGACASNPSSKTLNEHTIGQPIQGVVEQTTDIGFGFRRVLMAVPVNASFESIGHLNFLYYRDQQICQIQNCSVSPSGRYAIYQDGRFSGNLFLFRSSDQRITQLTPHFLATVDEFKWHEESATVEVDCTTWPRVKKFSLE